MQRLTCLLIMACAVTASADPRRDPPRRDDRGRVEPQRRAEPRRDRGHRTRATVVRQNTNVRVYRNPRTGREVRRGIVYERRPISVIRRDPYVVRYDYNYRPRFGWRHYHPTGWFGVWNIRSWNYVSTVSCEAVNEETGELYPVYADRGSFAWNDQMVDGMLDQALDECAAENGPDVCVPVQPACSYQ